MKLVHYLVSTTLMATPAALVACSAEPDGVVAGMSDDADDPSSSDADDGSLDGTFAADLGSIAQPLCGGGGGGGGGGGVWQCTVVWGAKTTQRMIKGPTDFECACGFEPFHTCGESWVDIVGGISQSCEDHSSSFFGPIDGEWHGCSGAPGNQVSLGERALEGVNQAWDRWPTAWRSGTYRGDLSHLTRTDAMRGPFATVYDLDRCINKQLINTLFWPNFPVTAQLASGDPAAAIHSPAQPASVIWKLSGSTPQLCSDQDGVLADSGEFSGPKRPPVCSDLIVDGTFSCQYRPAGVAGIVGAGELGDVSLCPVELELLEPESLER